MAGKPLSVYVDDDTANAVAEIAKATGVKKASLGGRALKFYANLSDDARRAIIGIENEGTSQDKQFVMREVTRVLALAHFRIVERKLVEQINPELVGNGTDAAIEAATNEALRR